MIYRINAETGISDYYFCDRRKNASSTPHIHSHIEFIYILDGSLNLTINGETSKISRNTMAIVMPYEVHNYSPEVSSDTFIIACPPEYISEYRQIFYEHDFLPSYTPFSDIIKQIVADIISSDYKDNFKKQALLYYTLSGFMENCQLKKKRTVEYDAYRKALVYISQHYTENITLDTVAQNIGVSSAHLSRLLNKKGYSSFSDILNSLRVYEAKRLLEKTNISISEAAYESGFGSIRNFNRIFNKFFGCTPKEIKAAKYKEKPTRSV